MSNQPNDMIWDLNAYLREPFADLSNLAAVETEFFARFGEIFNRQEALQPLVDAAIADPSQPQLQVLDDAIRQIHADANELYYFAYAYSHPDAYNSASHRFNDHVEEQISAVDEKFSALLEPLVFSEEQFASLGPELSALAFYSSFRSNQPAHPDAVEPQEIHLADSDQPRWESATRLYNHALSDEALKQDPDAQAEALARALDAKIYQHTNWAQAEGISVTTQAETAQGLPRGYLEDVLERMEDLEDGLPPPSSSDTAPSAYSWEEAKATALEVFARMEGTSMANPDARDKELVREAEAIFERRGIHALSSEEKKAGAWTLPMPHQDGAKPMILMHFDGTPASVVSLCHETAHALAFTLESRANPKNYGHKTADALQETFAHFAEQLTRDILLERAASPEHKTALAQDFSSKKRHSLTLSGLVTTEIELYRLMEQSPEQPLNVTDIAATARECGAAFPQEPDSTAAIRLLSSPHLTSADYKPFYTADYVLAEAGASAMMEVFNSLPEKGREAFVANWKNAMRDYAATDFVQALENVGVDVQNPETLVKASERQLEQYQKFARPVPSRATSSSVTDMEAPSLGQLSPHLPGVAASWTQRQADRTPRSMER